MSRRTIMLALIALVLAPLRAPAFTLLRVDGNPCGSAQNLFWSSRAATVDVSHLQPPAFQTYATQGRDRWNQAISTFRFVAGGGTFCDPNDGVTSMGFSQTVCNGSAFGDSVSVTYFRFNNVTGAMLDADVTFDAADPDLTDSALFTQIAMHELGHVLGLAHSDACGASGRGTLMQAVTPLNEARLDHPQADDIAGARTIYPGDTGPPPPGTNACAITPGPLRRLPALPVLLVPLVVVLARARRARATTMTTPERVSR